MENKFNIKMDSFILGSDIVFHVTGHEPHIGAVSIAYWLNDKVIVETEEVPKHREGELSKELALLATRTLKKTSTVILGIHFNQATKEEIDYIEDYVRAATKVKIRELAQENIL